MKKTLMVTLIAALTACGGGGDGGVPSTTLAESSVTPPAGSTGVSQTTAPTTPGAAVDTTQLLSQTYQNGLADIALANIALQRAESARVRRFAQMIIDDHNRANTLIQQQAQARGVTLPTTPSAQQTTVQGQLAALTGAEFDRAYLSQNISTHEQDVVALLQAADSTADAQTALLGSTLLPVIKVHLAMAEELLASSDPNAYLVIAYRHGLVEILLSTLARDRSTNTAIPPFAQMLIDHHTMINNAIRLVAQQRGVALPDAPSAAETALQNSLTQLAGADFDKAYLSENVDIHIGDVAATTAQAASNKDNEVRVLAAEALPKLTNHLRMATDLYNSVIPSFPAIAFQSNVGEVLLANRALARSTQNDVLTFAQRMVTEHTSANADVIALAAKKGVRLPRTVPAEFFLAHRVLFELNGTAFDLAYMQANVRAHDKAVAVFTNRANNETDPDYRAYAAATLPNLQSHLDEATRIRDALATNASGNNGTSNGATNTGTANNGTTGNLP